MVLSPFSYIPPSQDYLTKKVNSKSYAYVILQVYYRL